MRVKVLGSAAGGGFPQWNCGCSNCSRLRGGVLKGQARTQAQVAVSPDNSSWFLLNASPDLRQQILSDSDFAPAGASRATPIVAVVLTSADTDCVLGLLHLREFQPLRIYSTPSVRRVLTEENTLFRTLERSTPPVRWETLPLDRPMPVSPHDAEVGAKICFRALSLNGDFPDYVSDTLRQDLAKTEAVIALELTHGEKRFWFAPTLPGLNEELKRRIGESQLALLDGTFWMDNELIDVRGTGKTARQIGHMPLSGRGGLLEQMQGVSGPRRVLIHLNNTNPALDEDSAAHRALQEAGWELAYDGMEIVL